jgi:hypothetical protein
MNILFKYELHEQILKNVEIKPQKVNIIQLEKSFVLPSAIVLNYDDKAYSLQKYDKASLGFLKDKFYV